jgi:hypothetical protein
MMLDRLDANRGGEMRLAHAGAADQYADALERRSTAIYPALRADAAFRRISRAPPVSAILLAS